MNYFKLLIIFPFVLVLGACSTNYTPRASRPFEPITEFSSTSSVALINAQTSEDRVEVYSFFLQKSIYGDLNAWTGTAIEIAERELHKRGMTVSGGAPKTLKMSVQSAHTETGAIKITTEVVMRVETSDGYSATYTGRNSSVMAANLDRQMDGAMMRVVHEMLMDPRIVAFLTK